MFAAVGTGPSSAMTVFVAALVSSSIGTFKEVCCGGAVGAHAVAVSFLCGQESMLEALVVRRG